MHFFRNVQRFTGEDFDLDHGLHDGVAVKKCLLWGIYTNRRNPAMCESMYLYEDF